MAKPTRGEHQADAEFGDEPDLKLSKAERDRVTEARKSLEALEASDREQQELEARGAERPEQLGRHGLGAIDLDLWESPRGGLQLFARGTNPNGDLTDGDGDVWVLIGRGEFDLKVKGPAADRHRAK